MKKEFEFITKDEMKSDKTITWDRYVASLPPEAKRSYEARVKNPDPNNRWEQKRYY